MQTISKKFQTSFSSLEKTKKKNINAIERFIHQMGMNA
jgi:hypothetical protein